LPVVSEVSSHEVTNILRSTAFIIHSEPLLSLEIYLCLIQTHNASIVMQMTSKTCIRILAISLCFAENLNFFALLKALVRHQVRLSLRAVDSGS
jgi:hypothetical protein